MNLFGLLFLEIVGAALFSLAFFGGLQKVKSLCYSSLVRQICYIHIAIQKHLDPLWVRVLQLFYKDCNILAVMRVYIQQKCISSEVSGMERFLVLYESVYKDLYRLAYFYLGNPQDAEDVVGETVMQSLQKICCRCCLRKNEKSWYWRSSEDTKGKKQPKSCICGTVPFVPNIAEP